MPRAALQQDEISAFRRKAADAAMHLFATYGYDAVTMRAVGDALGVSAMTAYRYMAGKLVYGDALLDIRFDKFLRPADRVVIVVLLPLENHELQLRGALNVDGEIFCRAYGRGPVDELFDKIKQQVKI